MSRFIDKDGNIHKIDSGNNHFVNGKCVNPKGYEDRPIGDTINDYDVEDLSIVKGHVHKFEYGHGENRVEVKTGRHSW